jgi:hypothetical protein
MSDERFQGFHWFQRFQCFALAIACFAGASAQESLTAIRAGRIFDARTGAMMANQIIPDSRRENRRRRTERRCARCKFRF